MATNNYCWLCEAKRQLLLNKTNNCPSEESLNLTHEESRENSCSFTSRKIMRSFRQKPDIVQRATCKLCPVFVPSAFESKQEYSSESVEGIFLQLVPKQSQVKEK